MKDSVAFIIHLCGTHHFFILLILSILVNSSSALIPVYFSSAVMQH
jgi:hypothetical protein